MHCIGLSTRSNYRTDERFRLQVLRRQGGPNVPEYISGCNLDYGLSESNVTCRGTVHYTSMEKWVYKLYNTATLRNATSPSPCAEAPTVDDTNPSLPMISNIP